MRLRVLWLFVATSILGAGCSSAPVPAQRLPADAPPAPPAVVAEKLGGFWLFSIQRGGQSIDHALHIALTSGELVGSLTGPDGNAREISKIALKGNRVSWEIEGQASSQKFEGTLKNASSMEGTIKFSRGSRGGDDSGGGSGGRGGGSGGRGGRRGGGRGGGRGGSESPATWKAFKSVEPAASVPARFAGQ